MPKPRKLQIALSETPYYHLISRCVRRAFLCGRTETYNFEHRRGWILARLHQLTQMFAIDIAAFALMSNHYHLVVRVDTTKAALSMNSVDTHSNCQSAAAWQTLRPLRFRCRLRLGFPLTRRC
jgi:hypothetical protein